jgi:hypothetical protein
MHVSGSVAISDSRVWLLLPGGSLRDRGVLFEMNYLPWLKSGTHGCRIRQSWKADTPLPVSEGGSTEALSPKRFESFKTFFEEGKSLTGLLCLTALNNEFDSKLFVQDPIQVEKLARILFTDGQAADAEAKELLSDDWYSKHSFRFPDALADKETIPVVVRDLSKMPATWRMLGMCEWVSAFWKIVDRIGKMLAAAEADVANGGLTPEQTAAAAATVNLMKGHLEKARAMQRNVVVSVTYCSSTSDHDFEHLVVAKREGMTILSDFAGIQGWNFVQLVGVRRDDILKTAQKVSNDMITASFKGVTWSAGRVLTNDSVDKILRVYNTVRKTPGVQAWVQRAFAYFGRRPPLEQYTILLALLSMGKDDAEVLTVIKCLVLEKVAGTCDNLSKNEIMKATGMPNNWILRHRAVAGALVEWLVSGKNALAALPKQTATDNVLAAMTKFGTIHGDYETYFKEDGGMTPAMKETLPTWVSVDLRSFVRNVYSGRRDCYWTSSLSRPPRGGLKAVAWDGPLKEHLASDVKKIEGAFQDWMKTLKPEQGEEDGPSEFSKALAELGITSDSKDGGIAPASDTGVSTLTNIRKEIQDQANTYRSHWFTVLPLPQAATDAIRLVQGSGAWQSTQTDGRVAFVYSLAQAFDREEQVARGERQYALPLWDEDFSIFARTIDELITKDNKHYAVILLGRQGLRQSSSLTCQYGIATDQKVLRTLKDLEADRKKKCWRPMPST